MQLRLAVCVAFQDVHGLNDFSSLNCGGLNLSTYKMIDALDYFEKAEAAANRLLNLEYITKKLDDANLLPTNGAVRLHAIPIPDLNLRVCRTYR